ncbi:MAG: CPBP family intramembrane metalloprotease [Lachnospiraceae bacterium]|nr:CPBP family intramembrane metalloprotease [Lachnospiraceae bacterium]
MCGKGIRKAIWRWIYPVLLYEILSFLAAFVTISIPGIRENDLSLAGILINALLIVPIFGYLYIQDCRRPERLLRRQFNSPLKVYGLIWIIAGSAVLAIVGNIVISLSPLVEWSSRFQETQEAVFSGSFRMQILASVLAAPILEEFLVRGLLYQRMRDVMGVRTAVVFSAAFFGILHGNLVQGVYAFFMGIYFAWLMERFQNIKIPILGHMAANLAVLLLLC